MDRFMAGKFEKIEKGFRFFTQCLDAAQSFEVADIVAATGWSLSSVKTYTTKRWDSFLVKTGAVFHVTEAFRTFTLETFIQHHSQKDSVKKYFYQLLVDKAVSSCISSIEIYNKPDFKFREESFSILLVNSWELLLKAKILKDTADQLDSITFFKNGQAEISASGNPKTISITKALNILSGSGVLKPVVAENIKLLIEIRDESVHFLHTDLELATKIQCIGTASLKNFMTLAMEWFGVDFRRYNFYLMPVSFFHLSDMESFSVDNDATDNLMRYLDSVEQNFSEDPDPQFSITLRLETKFVKSSSEEAVLVRVTDDPEAPEIQISEEDALKSYPFTYESLCATARARFSDFKANTKFHDIMRGLKAQGERFCKERRLDPRNPQSIRKMFYHSRIIEELDKHFAIES